jgi:bacterioferritin B
MLTSEKIVSALNEQIGNEFGASLQYIAIASHFASESLSGLAHHFYKQSDEERDHAMRFVRYVVDVGGRVAIPSIPAPETKFRLAEEAVKLSLDRELLVTHQINQLVELAKSESDHITLNFLQFFLKEQLEEVSSMENLLRVIQRAGEGCLLLVEEHLSQKRSLKNEDVEEVAKD